MGLLRSVAPILDCIGCGVYVSVAVRYLLSALYGILLELCVCVVVCLCVFFEVHARAQHVCAKGASVRGPIASHIICLNVREGGRELWDSN
jgi:hypothetical protein